MDFQILLRSYHWLGSFKSRAQAAIPADAITSNLAIRAERLFRSRACRRDCRSDN